MNLLSADKKKELADYWRLGSLEDLESAKVILKSGKRPGPALFYLHLALEKALKFFYVEKFGTHAPYSHNLIILLEKLEWQPSDEQLQDLSIINQFNTTGRYPESKADLRSKFTAEFAALYLEKGEQLWNWIFAH